MIRLFLNNYQIFSALIAALMILAGHFLLSIPLAVNLAASLGLFAGLLLIGSYGFDYKIRLEARSLSDDDIKQRIGRGLRQVSTIRGTAGMITDPVVKAKVMNVCDLAERMLKGFAKDQGRKVDIGRFLLYLDHFLPVVEKYSYMSSTPEGREMMMKTTDDAEFWELLHSAQETFETGYNNWLQNDVVELRTMGRDLKKMIHLTPEDGAEDKTVE